MTASWEELFTKVKREEIPPIPDKCLAPVSGPVSLKGKIAIVTGAKGGIGRATCFALAREGANVVAADILPCDETVEGIRALGRESFYIKTDVTKETDTLDMVKKTVEKFGKVDILVNNAGICDRTILEDVTLEEWNRNIDIDLTGTFLCTKAVWNVMKNQKSGKIVCIGSVAGKVGGVISGPHYVAAKAGVHAFVKWCAKHGAPHGIYINAIAPGPVWTAMTLDFPYNDAAQPLGRVGRPEDIAETVIFLASDMSNWITGCALDVNGGLLMTL